MKKAELVHVENKVEYYKDGNLYNPTEHEKILWSLFEMPDNVQMFKQEFETVIDFLTGFTNREIEAVVSQNFKNGKYNFLPHIGFTDTVVLRISKSEIYEHSI